MGHRDKKLIEIYVEVKRQSEMAILASDGVSEFWLPKSQITMTHKNDDDYEIEMPEWLAIEKGVV